MKPEVQERQQLRVFVAPIRIDQDNAAVREFFERWGCKVRDCYIPPDRDSGKQKGFGFVTLADAESYKLALSLDGYQWCERELDIKPARPRGGL